MIMYIINRFAIVIVLFCLVSSFAAGENEEFHFSGQDIIKDTMRITVDREGGKYTLEEGELTIKIIVDNESDFADLRVELRREEDVTVPEIIGEISEDNTARTFIISKEDLRKTGEAYLWIGKGGNKLVSYPLVAEANSQGGEELSRSIDQLDQLLRTPCPGEYEATSYDAENNEGHIILTPTGNVLDKDLDLFDENDALVVKIVGDKRLLPLLKVKRTSPFRRKGIVRLVGEEAGIARYAVEEPECGEREFIVQDFEPGKGEIEISVIGDPDRVIGNFEFNVNPLYTGIISYGGVWTRAVDPDLKLVTSETEEAENILIKGNAGEGDLLYALLYTPYIWGKRDLEKIYPWYKYINPTVGIVPNDITNHALLGVSIDLPIGGILFTVGAHVRRIDALAQDTEAEIGEPYAVGRDADDVELSTSRELDTDLFFAVSVDLRAAVKVVKAALSVAAGNN
jgi:hypothetical protein